MVKKSSVVLPVLLSASLVATPAVQALAITRAEVNAAGAASQSAETTASIAQAAISAGISGAYSLQTYLAGGAISESEFLSIDAGSLYAIDGTVASEIANYQAVLNAATVTPVEPTVTPEPETPAIDDTTTPGTNDGDTDGADKPGSDETYDPSADDKDGNTDDSTKDDTAKDDAIDDATKGDTEKPDDSTNSDNSGAKEETKAEESKNVNDSDNTEASNSGVNTAAETTTTPSRTISANLTTQKFVAVIGDQAREVAAENDLYASVMIAQAILESGSGNSTLSKSPNNNLFGIKGNYDGNSVVMRTQEDDGTGAKYTIAASFRKYDNMRESLEDYADLLTGQMGSFYAGAHKSNADTYKDACEYLQGRYATDTTYASQLEGIIHAYDLTKYDEPLSYQTSKVYEVQATDETTGELLYNEDGTPKMEERTLTDLVTELTSHLNAPYVWGAQGPDTFDCSGLAYYCYKQALGITLPRVADDQSKVGQKVDLVTEDELLDNNNVSTYGMSSEDAAETLKTQLVEADFNALHAGDLLFFTNSDGYAYHVAIYLGEGCYIQAPSAGDVVKVTSLAEFEPNFAMRVVPVQEAETERTEEATEAETATEPELSAIEKAKLLAAKTANAYRSAQSARGQEAEF